MAQQMPVSGAVGGEKMAAPLRDDLPATSIHLERARRELLRAAMDAVEEWVVVVDAQGGIQFLNAPYAEFLGVEASEVLAARVPRPQLPCPGRQICNPSPSPPRPGR